MFTLIRSLFPQIFVRRHSPSGPPIARVGDWVNTSPAIWTLRTDAGLTSDGLALAGDRSRNAHTPPRAEENVVARAVEYGNQGSPPRGNPLAEPFFARTMPPGIPDAVTIPTIDYLVIIEKDQALIFRRVSLPKLGTCTEGVRYDPMPPCEVVYTGGVRAFLRRLLCWLE